MDSTLQESLISLRRIIRATESSARELAKKADMATSELLTLQSVADNPGISPGELAKSRGGSLLNATHVNDAKEADLARPIQLGVALERAGGRARAEGVVKADKCVEAEGHAEATTRRIVAG